MVGYMDRRGLHRWRRWVIGGLTPMMLASGGLFALPTAYAAPTRAGTPCPDDFGVDFDGQRGGSDLAIGVPGEDVGAKADAGVVEIRYGCSTRPDQALSLPTEHSGDRFGASVAAGPINGDRYADLAVGVPGLDVGGRRNAGGVALFYGSATGLHFEKLITQSSSGVPGSAQSGAHFGATVAFSRVEADVASVLRIGEPGRNVNGAVDAGGFVDLVVGLGSTTGLKTREVTLASAGVPGSPHTGDQLGAALYQTFVVGAPGRAVAGHAGAGAILRTTRSETRLLTQNSPGAPGTAEAGDHFGAALAGSWIGVPGESIGSVAGAGAVERIATDPAEAVLLTQASPGVPGTLEANDHFGAALAELGVVVDDVEWSPRQLYVGSPGEDVGSAVDAGAVAMIGEANDPDGDPFHLTGLYAAIDPATVTAGAQFGAALAHNGLHTMVIGAPSAGGGSATVEVAPDNFGAAPVRLATLTQTKGTPESGDSYGSSFVTGPA